MTKLKQKIKSFLILISPLALFPVLFMPYGLLNSNLLVDWLGCGCEMYDELGNRHFTANDFTAYFCLLLVVCTLVLAFFLRKRLEKKWLRAVYLVAILFAALFFAYNFRYFQLWN